MPGQHIELQHVTRITIDAVGPPGRRVFLLQASDALDTITLKLEKEQARALAYKAQELLEAIEEQFFANRADPEAGAPTPDLLLSGPLEPLFAIGQMGLGYDSQRDRVVLAAQELTLEEEAANPSTAQFWITRTQLRAMSEHALHVIRHGRPICPLCGQPIDPDGHFCPPQNGHQRYVQ